MGLFKMGPFLRHFFVGNRGQENVFYDILEPKNVFLVYENKKFKTSKIEIFAKGLVHGFAQKRAICPSFCFRQERPGKCVL